MNATAPTSKVESVTLFIALSIHAGFVALTLSYHLLPHWLFAVCGSVLLAWYGSLQHETIHGHPTSSRRFNSLLGALPLSLWLPYTLYQESHLRHHRHEGHYLTDVDRDPESFYWSAPTSVGNGRFSRTMAYFHSTLAGRLLLGPVLMLCRFWACEASKIRRGVGFRRVLWMRHAAGLSMVIGWLMFVCHVPLPFYALCLVYPSISLGLLRSFAEHRADGDIRRRTRVVESGRFWSLLFLNNNLHIAHHAHPHLPWYELPSAWSAMRRQLAAPELVMAGGYLEVARRYFAHSVMMDGVISGRS